MYVECAEIQTYNCVVKQQSSSQPDNIVNVFFKNWLNTLLCVLMHYMQFHDNWSSISTGGGPIITIFFLFLSDYFYVVQYKPSSTS